MRIPLATNLESRDGLLDKDAKVLNGVIETRGENVAPIVRKRPGLSNLGTVHSGTGQLLTDFYGLNVIIGDSLY